MNIQRNKLTLIHTLPVFMRVMLVIVMASVCLPLYATSKISIVGNGDNDLYRLMLANGIDARLYGTIDDAVNSLSKGSGLVVTATAYPSQRTEITEQQYTAIASHGTRLFIEYPSFLPGYTLGADNVEGTLERGVVTSGFFGKCLPEMSILGINGCTYIPVETKSMLIAFAKVAGFDTAQFGLADTETHPILFFADKNRMVATTRLSQFKQGRFGPVDSWKTAWQGILRWLTRDNKLSLTIIDADPIPTMNDNACVDDDARLNAIRRGAEWLSNANLFIHPSWEMTEIGKYQPKNGDPNLFFGPAITSDMLHGDGSRGVMEGHGSTILADGSQLYRYFIRADVQGETSMLLAAAAETTGDGSYTQKAERLLDYLFYTSGFRGDTRNNPDSCSYGMIGWANTHPGTFFNDDNARCILGAIGASSMMNNQRWNRFIVENVLANLRTASRQGYLGAAIEQRDLERNGTKYYSDRDFVHLHPHFESWMWACYLWLYDKTGYQPLLDKAREGIRVMMEGYPDNWLTQNGMQQQRARMILPLAWLVRIEDTPLHRKWLDDMVSALLDNQVACGAIRDEIGSSEQDKNKLLVTSNDAYGKNEAPLIAVNGDPVADMLYTCNFSFFSLNEAAHATGNPRYHEAVKNLADFLVRIQVSSQAHHDIDGGWFRAFDYDRWDYWASNADNGWGAWCTLTGWIQSWIVTTEAMILKNQSYWDITKNMDMKDAMSQSLWMMDR